MKQLAKWILTAAGFALAAFLLFGQDTKGVPAVSVGEAYSMISADSTIVILDVRTTAEYSGALGHIKNAILIPVQDIEQRVAELEKFKHKKILVICRTGRRSGIAVSELAKKGFNAVNISGGMVQWKTEGLPVAQ